MSNFVNFSALRIYVKSILAISRCPENGFPIEAKTDLIFFVSFRFFKMDGDWKYKIPTKFIDSFLEIAARNKSELDGRHVETLGFLIGTKEGNLITATDLIIPKQEGNSAIVKDEGKNCFAVSHYSSHYFDETLTIILDFVKLPF